MRRSKVASICSTPATSMVWAITNPCVKTGASRRRRDKAFVCVKFGAQRSPDGRFVGVDCRPASVKNFLAYSLQRLGNRLCRSLSARARGSFGTDRRYGGSYRRPCKSGLRAPPRLIGSIRRDRTSGYSGSSGRSPADRIFHHHSRYRRPRIACVARSRSQRHRLRRAISRGLLGGQNLVVRPRETSGPTLPRFAGENLQANLKIIEGLRGIAADRGISVSQLCIAWALSRGEDIVPLIGARTRTQLQDALGAMEISLTAEELDRIEKAAPANAVAGTRYGADQMAMLNG
jgi:pyridoxine 4-dehydrogenase